jgi:hypothetical protein
MPFPCSVNSHMPCRDLPFPDSAVSLVKVRVVDGNIRTAGLLLVNKLLRKKMYIFWSVSHTCITMHGSEIVKYVFENWWEKFKP